MNQSNSNSLRTEKTSSLLIVLYAVSGLVVLVALSAVIFGPEIFFGEEIASPAVDNQLRFLFALYAGFGLIAMWATKRMYTEKNLIRLILRISFAGGLARLWSYLVVGNNNGSN